MRLEAYDSMLPSITELVQKYRLDIEVALQVLSPLCCHTCAAFNQCVPLEPKIPQELRIQHAPLFCNLSLPSVHLGIRDQHTCLRR